MKKIWSIVAALTIGIGLSGCGQNKKNSSTGATADKDTPIRMVNGSKGNTRIWYGLDAKTFSDDQKNTVPFSIVLIKDNMATYYNTPYDETNTDKNVNYSMGQLSKMTDKQIIAYVKKEDRLRYDFEAKGIKELDSHMDKDDYNYGIMYSYVKPTPQKITLNFATDGSGNNVQYEEVGFAHIPEIMYSPNQTHNPPKFNKQYWTLDEPINDRTTIYNSYYYGYRYVDDKDSSNNEFFMTRATTGTKFELDSPKTKGATIDN